MNVRPEVDALEDAMTRFAVPLRMGDGIDELALADLRKDLRSCADAWQRQELIPKRAASMLAEMFPVVEGCAGLYDQDYARRVLDTCVELHDLVMACTRPTDADGAAERGPDQVQVAGDDVPADGMHVAVRLRHDFTITDAQRLLAAARAAYVECSPGTGQARAEEAVTAVADVMFTILEHDGLIGDPAEAKLAAYSGDGLALGGWRAQVTTNEPRQLPPGSDCLHLDDVFALPPGA